MNQAHPKLERVRLWLEVFALGFGIFEAIVDANHRAIAGDASAGIANESSVS
jgi:hypothetical protein